MASPPRLGVLATHPIQYHAPLWRALADRLDLHVYFAHRQTAEGQAAAGFGVAFEWDVPLLDGYAHTFLTNEATHPSTEGFRGCSTPEIADIIARERFDAFLVTGWYNRSFWQAMRACWRTGTPLMVRGDSQLATPRRWWLRAAKESFYRWFIPRFDAYLLVGQRSEEYYLHYGAEPSAMHFVPHYVDNAWFRERAEQARQQAAGPRAEFGIDDEAAVLLFVGKFIPKKRPADLIAAASRLAERGHRVEVVFVGSGELEAALRADAAQAAVPVHFAGFKNQSELPAYYVGADVLVLPSDGGETWGLVVNEAMACGLPAVVSEAAGCAPDLINPGQTGYGFPLGDLPALAGALERMLRRRGDPDVRRALAAKMDTYSLATATDGVLRAVEAARRPTR